MPDDSDLRCAGLSRGAAKSRQLKSIFCSAAARLRRDHPKDENRRRSLARFDNDCEDAPRSWIRGLDFANNLFFHEPTPEQFFRQHLELADFFDSRAIWIDAPQSDHRRHFWRDRRMPRRRDHRSAPACGRRGSALHSQLESAHRTAATPCARSAGIEVALRTARSIRSSATTNCAIPCRNFATPRNSSAR